MARVMGMILKTVVAFSVGAGMLFGVQHLWVSSITAQIAAQSQTPALPQAQAVSTIKVDPEKLRQAINPAIGKKIDTTTGQRLAVEGAARRIDLMNRAAQSAVPVPRHYPGMPRY